METNPKTAGPPHSLLSVAGQPRQAKTEEAHEAKMLELYTRFILQVEDLKDRLRSQKGQGMVEYGLILVLVSIAVIGTLIALNGQLKTVFNNVVNGLAGGSGT